MLKKLKVIKISIMLILAIILTFPFLLKKPNLYCPKDYCEKEVKGSGPCPFWTNKTESYYEQKCYDYPERASSLNECEAKKSVYYKICGVRATF